jgi:hypothetical protein
MYTSSSLAYFYNDKQMLNRFIQVVSGQEKCNRLGQPVDATPIVYIIELIIVMLRIVLLYLYLQKK